MREFIKIVSAAPAEAAAQINKLWEHYAPAVWNIQSVEGQAWVTCIMVLKSELPRPAIAMPVAVPGRMQ
jgi:hypothetical protein